MPGSRIKLNFKLNGKQVILQCSPDRRLIDILRLDFELTGTREGCGRGECGSCLVLMNGELVNSCLIPAFKLTDASIVTVEGLSELKGAADIQGRFAKIRPFRCGFCSSGIQMAVAVLMLQNPNPTENEIRDALSGNICFCSGSPAVIKAVHRIISYPKKKRYARRA